MLTNLESDASEVEGLGLLSVFPEGESYEVFLYPTDIDKDIPLRFGTNPLFTVYKLGQLSDPKAGISLVQRTLKNQLAVSIDGYILTDLNGINEFKRFFGSDFKFGNIDPIFDPHNLLKIKETLILLRKYLRTDLTTPEIFKILNFMRATRKDKQNFTKIDKGEFLDKVFLDSLRRADFSETKIALEGKSMVVLNGTDVGGLASDYSRFITNIGADLFAVDNAQKRYEKSIIIAQDLSSETLMRVSKTLGISDIRKKHEDLLIDEPAILRADIAIILGFDKAAEL